MPITSLQSTASETWISWEERARQMLVRAMDEQKVTYKALSRRLEALGISESPDRLNRKVNRAKFSAAFFLVCLQALEVPLQTGRVDSEP